MNLSDVEEYFYNLHDIEVNQKYNKNLPYSFHLEMVKNQALKFQYLMTDEDYLATWIGIFGHDSIEDARLTYNNIEEKFVKKAAEIIYLCTEDKGRNRSERKSKIWYEKLAKNKNAVFVKLCDIIANSLFSALSGSSMFDKYKSEYIDKVKPNLYCKQYEDMFDYLDKIYDL